MKAINIRKPAYCMATTDGQSAEITMYGDIYEQRPTDWYGNPVEGQFVLMDEFLEDLKSIEGCKDITIRMNSYGGDAGVSNTIHNRLRELAREGAMLTCIVDGVAMSGGSLIMCACDNVRVNPSSLIMIHKCWTFLWGGYNADELREQASQQDAWDKMQVEIYKRKTGLSDTVIMHMMSDTTYMTGRVAVEKGFADEIIEDAEPVAIAASADGRSLYVHGRAIHLAPGMAAPDSIPTVTSEASAPVKTNTQPASSGGRNGGNTMAKTLEQLRAEDPELAEQIMAEARAAVSAGTGTQASQAAAAERQRLADIDAVAGVFDAELVREAKYGDTPCTAQELAYRAAVKAAAQGKSFLAGLMADAANSGAAGVGATPPPSDKGNKAETPEQCMAEARREVKALLGRKEA